MFKYYFKIAVRNIFKHKLFISINILGLAAALTCCVIAYLNWDFDHRFNRFHENAARIFKINSRSTINGSPVKFAIVPLPMAPAIAEEVIGVEKAVRYSEVMADLKFGQEFFNSRVGYVDSSFLDVFTFHILQGDKYTLRDKSKIFISETLSEKHFKGENPVGKRITITYRNGKVIDYLVGGVFEKIPLNSSFRFEVLMSFENYTEVGDIRNDDWAALIPATFVLLKDPAQSEQVQQQLSKYVTIQNKAREDFRASSFYLEPLLEMAGQLEEVRANVLVASLPASAIISPIVMAVLMLLLAAFNFANTSLAISSSRMKEIGLRKVFGGTRKQIVQQFLGENVFTCLIALLLALLLAKYFVPAYSSLWSFLDIKLDYFQNWEVPLLMILLLVLTGVLAGAYPAFYVSSFNPASIFSKKIKLFGTNGFMRVLLVFQFSISLLSIIAGVVFSENAEYQESLEMGFNPNQTIVVEVKDESTFQIFKNLISQNPKIISVAGSEGHIGRNSYNVNMKSGDRQIFAEGLHVSPGFIETTEIKVLKGRNFEERSEKDIRESVLVTEQLVKEMGWTDPLNQKVSINDTLQLDVIGVVKNIYMRGLWEPVRPLFLRASNEKNYHFLTAKVKSEDLFVAKNLLETQWKSAFPNVQYKSFLQEEILYEARTINKNIRILFTYLAVIAMLLSASGLFSMVSLNVIKRTRELGIRKILGASIGNIAYLIMKEFLLVFVLSSILGSVIAFLFVSWLLSSIYTYHTSVGLMAFVISITLLVLISIATVGQKIFKTAGSNPINSIREN